MFAINGNRLPSCNSYLGAKAIWGKAEIINKNDPNVRGLVSKCEADKVVYMEGETVCFRYHRTTLVRWHDEGHVSFVHHESQSSRTFIDRFTPQQVWIRSLDGRTIVNNVLAKYDRTDWHYSEPQGKWVVDPETAKPFHQIKVDVGISRRAAKAVQPVFDWVTGVAKLRSSFPVCAYQQPTLYDIQDLRRAIDTGVVSQHMPAIWNRFGHSGLKHAACLAMGGLALETLPLGQAPKKSVYGRLEHLISLYDPSKMAV